MTSSKRSDDRKMQRIFVRPAAKQVIERWAAKQDMSEIGVASRIYEWFAEQPEELQRGILGLYGSQERNIAMAALARMVDPEATANKPPNEGVQWYVDRILDPAILRKEKPEAPPQRKRKAG